MQATDRLSAQLRAGTKEVHSRAESSPFMQGFFQGEVPRHGYRELLARLLPVYEAMETQQRRLADHPAVGKLNFPELYRVVSLSRDLEFYYGPEWRNYVIDTPAVKQYTGRIAELAESWPTGLAAHYYTRYLGDLSGGQMIKRMVQESFELADGEGVAFYDFPEIANIPAFKNDYRKQLDAIPLADGEASRVVAEARHAFALNVGLFEELDELRSAAA